MTELERRALLGDRQAQEECTRQGIVLPCPFCGGKAYYSKYTSSGSGDLRGWRFGIECTKCRTHLPKSTYYVSVDFSKDGDVRVCNDERKDALQAWNTRHAQSIGWCKDCKNIDRDLEESVLCSIHDDEVMPNYGYCHYFEPKE